MPPIKDSMTPIPTGDLLTLTTAVARIDQNVRSIKNDLIPPLSTDTREARDKAREALQKVDGHMGDTDSHEHPCVEGARQERQDNELAKNRGVKGEISSLSKVFWVAVSIITTIVAGSYGYTLLISNATTENKTVNTAQEQNINRHEETINELRVAQQRDRETFIREQRAMPAQLIKAVRAVRPTVEDLEDVADELPLTEREARQMNELLKRAKKRSNGGAKNGEPWSEKNDGGG